MSSVVVNQLISACERGDLAIVKQLVKNGADVNDRGWDGKTPLIVACRNGHLGIVNFLLDLGAGDYETEIHQHKTNGVMVHACQAGQLEVIKLLISRGYDTKYNYGGVLFEACASKNLDILEYLLSKGVDIDSRSSSGVTALQKSCAMGDVAAAELLISKGASLDRKSFLTQSPLCLACSHEKLPVVRLLISKGANIDFTNSIEESPLTIACKRNYIEIAKTFIEAGTDINTKDCHGVTPLMTAVTYMHREMVSFLLRKNADVNSKDKWGDTALFYLIRSVNATETDYALFLDLFQTLLVNGANIYVRNRRANKILNLLQLHSNGLPATNKLLPYTLSAISNLVMWPLTMLIYCLQGVSIETVVSESMLELSQFLSVQDLL